MIQRIAVHKFSSSNDGRRPRFACADKRSRERSGGVGESLGYSSTPRGAGPPLERDRSVSQNDKLQYKALAPDHDAYVLLAAGVGEVGAVALGNRRRTRELEA